MSVLHAGETAQARTERKRDKDTEPMPMRTYDPNWDAIKTWWRRFQPMLPAGYTGLVGVRLHRVGYPLTFEVFGAALPDKPLYPMLVLEVKNGALLKTWDAIELAFDVPWVSQRDYDALRIDTMSFYHAEDLIEPRAEAILSGEATDEDTLRKSIVDHADVFDFARV